MEADLGQQNIGLASAWRKAATRDDWRCFVDTAPLQRSTLWKKKKYDVSGHGTNRNSKMYKSPVRSPLPTYLPSKSFFAGRMPFLSPNQQCQSSCRHTVTISGHSVMSMSNTAAWSKHVYNEFTVLVMVLLQWHFQHMDSLCCVYRARRSSYNQYTAINVKYGTNKPSVHMFLYSSLRW